MDDSDAKALIANAVVRVHARVGATADNPALICSCCNELVLQSGFAGHQQVCGGFGIGLELLYRSQRFKLEEYWTLSLERAAENPSSSLWEQLREKRKRGRPGLPTHQKDEALYLLRQGAPRREVAAALYNEKDPTEEQVKSIYSILTVRSRRGCDRGKWEANTCRTEERGSPIWQ